MQRPNLVFINLKHKVLVKLTLKPNHKSTMDKLLDINTGRSTKIMNE